MGEKKKKTVMADRDGSNDESSMLSGLKKLKFSNIKEFIEKTPCARSSFLYGITSGMSAGVVTFLYAKHIRRSCDIGVISFAAVSLGSWEWCRYNNRKEKEEIKKTVDLLTKYSNAKKKEAEKLDPKLT